jgi:hypothetical protein
MRRRLRIERRRAAPGGDGNLQTAGAEQSGRCNACWMSTMKFPVQGFHEDSLWLFS